MPAMQLIVEGNEKQLKAILMSSTVNVKEYRHLSLIPAFYFLPIQALRAFGDWVYQIPRNPQKILGDPKAIELIESNDFYFMVQYLYRFYTWNFLNSERNIYVYSKYEPIKLLCSHFEYWIEALQELDVLPTMEELLSGDSDMEFGCTPHWKFKLILDNATRWLLTKHPNFRGIVDAAKEYRCIEDYNEKPSRAKTNFINRWYHVRTQHPQISLEGDAQGEYDEDTEEYSHELADESVRIEEDVTSKLMVEGFLNTLSEKDKQILELRLQGYTLEEVAEQLGYKTHSAVIKRIKRIGEAYQKYAGTDLGFD